MQKITFVWCNVAFFFFGVSEVVVVFDLLNNVSWPPLFDTPLLIVMLLTPLCLAASAAFLSWFGQSTNLCLWVLAIWWPVFMVTAHSFAMENLTTYTYAGILRYQIGFLLSAVVICLLVHDLVKTSSLPWSRKMAIPIAAMSIVFAPWFTGYLFSTELVPSLIHAIGFASAFGYEAINRTPSK